MSAPEKRFPVRVSTGFAGEETPRPGSRSLAALPPVVVEAATGGAAAAPPRTEHHRQQLSLEDAVRENAGLRHAIDIFEDDASVSRDDGLAAGDATTTTTTTTMPRRRWGQPRGRGEGCRGRPIADRRR